MYIVLMSSSYQELTICKPIIVFSFNFFFNVTLCRCFSQVLFLLGS